MVDADGYRPNVGIVLSNDRGQVLWARRIGGQDHWQFPQGGINARESVEDALYRELHEEVGLEPGSVEILARTNGWLRYRLPKKMIRPTKGKVCIGQKQKWFLLKLNSDDQAVCLDKSPKPEFDRWEWVSYWYPRDQIVEFKRQVYQRMLKEFSVVHSQKVAAAEAGPAG